MLFTKIIVYWSLKGQASIIIINISLKIYLKAMLSFITIITGTIYWPAMFEMLRNVALRPT